MDKAAEAVVDITTSDPGEEVHDPVYHVVSTSHTTTYTDALHAARSQGLDFETIQPQVWLEKLVAARNAGMQHSCLNLLDTWQRNVS